MKKSPSVLVLLPNLPGKGCCDFEEMISGAYIDEGFKGEVSFEYVCPKKMDKGKGPVKVDFDVDEVKGRVAKGIKNHNALLVMGEVPFRCLFGKNFKRGARSTLPIFNRLCAVCHHPTSVVSDDQHRKYAESAIKSTIAFCKYGNRPDLQTAFEQVTPSMALEKLGGLDTVALDIETGGTPPHWDALDFIDGSIRSIAFCGKEGEAFGVSLEDAEIYQKGSASDFMLEVLHLRDKQWVIHNSTYEQKWFHQKYGKYLSGIVHDTMAIHHLLDEEALHSLADLTTFKAPEMAGYAYEMDHYILKAKDEGTAYSLVEMSKLLPYNCRDVDATLRCFNRMIPDLQSDGKLLWLYENIVSPSLIVLADFERNGMAFDQKKAEELKKKMDKKHKEIVDSLSVNEIVKKVHPDGFNPRSPKQVKEVLEGEMGIDTGIKTQTGNTSFSSKALKSLGDTNPVIEGMLSIASIKGLENSLKSFFQSNRDGVVRAGYTNSQVVTGRLACWSPNLLSIPNEAMFDVGEVFVSRFLNGRIVRADYKQLELRLVAHMTGEPKWLEGFRDITWDPHENTARDAGEDRSIGKRVNFGVVYGIGAKKLAIDAKKSVSWAKMVLDAFWNKNTYIKDWFADVKSQLTRKGYTQTQIGRIRRVPDAMLSDRDPSQWRAIRQGSNFMIQALAADIVAQAMVEVRKRCLKLRSDIYLMNQIHDALYIDCAEDLVEDAKRILELVMVKLVPAIHQIQVPLFIDVDVHETL